MQRNIMIAGLTTAALLGALAASIGLTAVATADATASKTGYTKNCVLCHGPTGKPPASVKSPDFSSVAWQKSVTDTKLVAVIENGAGSMPGYKKSLKPELIRGIVVHIRGMAK